MTKNPTVSLTCGSPLLTLTPQNQSQISCSFLPPKTKNLINEADSLATLIYCSNPGILITSASLNSVDIVPHDVGSTHLYIKYNYNNYYITIIILKKHEICCSFANLQDIVTV